MNLRSILIACLAVGGDALMAPRLGVNQARAVGLRVSSLTEHTTAPMGQHGTGSKFMPLTQLDSEELAPRTVQVGRMWSKRRKSETELGPEDPIAQIPGVGARYVARLQLHGVGTIGQFAAMAGTPQGSPSTS